MIFVSGVAEKMQLLCVGIIFGKCRILIGKKEEMKEISIMKYQCDVCGYVYDEAVGEQENGIAPGTTWEDLPGDYICPVCQMGKEFFKPE